MIREVFEAAFPNGLYALYTEAPSQTISARYMSQRLGA